MNLLGEDGQTEEREPGGDEEIRGANVLAVHGREAEPGKLRLNQGYKSEKQGDEASGVAQGPPIAGDAADARRGRNVGEKGVVEDEAHLETDVRENEPEKSLRHLPRQNPVERSGRDDGDDGCEQKKQLAVAAAIGQCAEDRRQERNRDGSDRHPARPQSGAADLVTGDDLCEEGCVDKGHDQRRER